MSFVVNDNVPTVGKDKPGVDLVSDKVLAKALAVVKDKSTDDKDKSAGIKDKGHMVMCLRVRSLVLLRIMRRRSKCYQKFLF